MTEKELEDIRFIKLEIERAEKLLRLGAVGAYAKVLGDSKAELQAKKAEAEALINGIKEAEIRLILKMKFIDLRSWNYIARALHYDRSTVYKKYQRFIKGVK